MEELAEINFIAAMEGQEAERAMAKIVSFMPKMSKLNIQMRTQYKDNFKKNASHSWQGFTKYNFMPLEVLAIIEHIQKRIGRVLSDTEIQEGALKDLINEEDYDIVKVVSTYPITQS